MARRSLPLISCTAAVTDAPTATASAAAAAAAAAATDVSGNGRLSDNNKMYGRLITALLNCAVGPFRWQTIYSNDNCQLVPASTNENLPSGDVVVGHKSSYNRRLADRRCRVSTGP